MIKAIFFDYYGVVGNWSEDIFFENISKLFNVKREVVSKLFYEDNFLDDIENGRKTSIDLMKELNNLTKKNIDFEEFKKTVDNVYSDNYEIVEFIKTIKDKYRIFITENAMDIDLPWQMKNVSSFKLFEKNYSSAELKARKDKSKFFKTILEETGLNPEEILYVDDGQKYVDTAKKLGINAYLYQGINQIKEILKNDK